MKPPRLDAWNFMKYIDINLSSYIFILEGIEMYNNGVHKVILCIMNSQHVWTSINTFFKYLVLLFNYFLHIDKQSNMMHRCSFFLHCKSVIDQNRIFICWGRGQGRDSSKIHKFICTRLTRRGTRNKTLEERPMSLL